MGEPRGLTGKSPESDWHRCRTERGGEPGLDLRGSRGRNRNLDSGLGPQTGLGVGVPSQKPDGGSPFADAGAGGKPVGPYAPRRVRGVGGTRLGAPDASDDGGGAPTPARYVMSQGEIFTRADPSGGREGPRRGLEVSTPSGRPKI